MVFGLSLLLKVSNPLSCVYVQQEVLLWQQRTSCYMWTRPL